jgi:hypothetical protein
MSALERLLAEELPTGTFGGRPEPAPAISQEEAASHRATLEAAIRKPAARKSRLRLVVEDDRDAA